MRRNLLLRGSIGILGTLLFSSMVLADYGVWKKISEDEGVITYVKADEDSDVITLRGETVIEAAPKAIFAIMKENKIAGEWVPRVVEKRNIRKISRTSRLEYTHVGLPWPLSDRYYINVGSVEHLENGIIKAFMKSAHDIDINEYREDDKVLGELKKSEFILTPQDNGQSTHIVVTVSTDPKGMIPKWMVNYAQKSWPRDFFIGLKNQLRKEGILSSLSD